MELLDVEDVSAGHKTKQVSNDRKAWVWSTRPSHEALVSSEDFEAVQIQLAAGAHRPVARKRRRTDLTYVMAGRVRCTLCDRRGHWNHHTAYYRCQYAAAYALANRVDHPKTRVPARGQGDPSSRRVAGQAL